MINPPVPPNQTSVGTLQRFTLKKHLLKVIGGEFGIYDDAGGIMYTAVKKGFKLVEEIDIFKGAEKTVPLILIRARKIIDFSGAFDIVDAQTGTRIAVLKRKGWNSLVRDEWAVCDANEMQIGQLLEDSLLMSLLRRLLSNLIPQNYDLLVNGGRAVDFKQNFNPFSYHLNVVIEQPFDPRVVLAMAVLLAANEGRQSGSAFS
jgi:hypothetical protein